MQNESEVLHHLLESARDFVLVLEPNRELSLCNSSFLASVNGASHGRDFMETVPLHARDRVLGQLVRAAAGDEVLFEVPHVNADGNPFTAEYRFYPLDGGRVGGIARPRGELPNDREALDRARAELRAKSRMLDEIQLELTQVPFIDPVTGVWNRMQVFERLTAEWSRCERYGSPLCVLLVDVEAVSAIRATEGADHADHVLKAVARRVKSIVRDHDIVGRYGDDSFVIVAVHADFEGAKSLSRRLRDGVSIEPITVDHRTTRVSLRIGGATNRSNGVEILEDLFNVAEQALAQARDDNDERFRVALETSA